MSDAGLLAPALDALAARRGTLRGRPAVLDFGAAAGEAETLATGVGLVPLLGRTIVAVSGRDRVDYLHRMLTQDVKGVVAGRGARACVLTPTGRILGALTLWNLGDPLLLDFDPGAAASALPVLERFVIADDVAFTDRSAEHARALLLGPGTAALLAQRGLAALAPGTVHELAVAGVRCWVQRRDFGARAAADLLLEPGAEGGATRVGEAFRAWAAEARPCGERAADRARCEEGVPAYGAELDERVLPNEARLEEAISWSKGCYPGQEPVVMAKHRGHPPTLLVRLSLTGPLPDPGATLLVDGKAAGRLTTVAEGAGGNLALGFVRHALARPGAAFSTEAGGSAHVLG